MNDTLKTLKERRSCRKYLPRQITDRELDAVLEAGTYAPSGGGRQSCVIVVMQDPQLIRRVSQLDAAINGFQADPFYAAPTVLAVLADPKCSCHPYDGPLVMGNLLNAAHSVGLGSCYIFYAREVFQGPEGKALLKEWGLPGDYVGIGFCLLGYPAEGGIRPAAPRKENYILRP